MSQLLVVPCLWQLYLVDNGQLFCQARRSNHHQKNNANHCYIEYNTIRDYYLVIFLVSIDSTR